MTPAPLRQSAIRESSAGVIKRTQSGQGAIGRNSENRSVIRTPAFVRSPIKIAVASERQRGMGKASVIAPRKRKERRQRGIGGHSENRASAESPALMSCAIK